MTASNMHHVEAALVELIVNTDLDIDQVEECWVNQFIDQYDYDVLGEIWIHVMSTMPELQ